MMHLTHPNERKRDLLGFERFVTRAVLRAGVSYARGEQTL